MYNKYNSAHNTEFPQALEWVDLSVAASLIMIFDSRCGTTPEYQISNNLIKQIIDIKGNRFSCKIDYMHVKSTIKNQF